MRSIVFFWLIAFVTFSSWAEEYNDVVHLKNGSIIKGTIIEQIPGQLIKVENPEGNIVILNVEEISKIVKERTGRTQSPKIIIEKHSGRLWIETKIEGRLFFDNDFLAEIPINSTAKLDNVKAGRISFSSRHAE